MYILVNELYLFAVCSVIILSYILPTVTYKMYPILYPTNTFFNNVFAY